MRGPGFSRTGEAEVETSGKGAFMQEENPSYIPKDLPYREGLGVPPTSLEVSCPLSFHKGKPRPREGTRHSHWGKPDCSSDFHGRQPRRKQVDSEVGRGKF